MIRDQNKKRYIYIYIHYTKTFGVTFAKMFKNVFKMFAKNKAFSRNFTSYTFSLLMYYTYIYQIYINLNIIKTGNHLMGGILKHTNFSIYVLILAIFGQIR